MGFAILRAFGLASKTTLKRKRLCGLCVGKKSVRCPLRLFRKGLSDCDKAYRRAQCNPGIIFMLLGASMKRMSKKVDSLNKKEISVALAGNPNVGKSTLFNSLTGMSRHTVNRAAKTVSVATSEVAVRGNIYSIADIPVTYSLLSHSHEDEVVRNYICFGGADVTVAVCDAASIENSLGLVLQIIEARGRVVVCVNLTDEAERLRIKIDIARLSELLGVPTVAVVARKKRTLRRLFSELESYSSCCSASEYKIKYPEHIEHAVKIVEQVLKKYDTGGVSARWLALRLVEGDRDMSREISEKLGIDISGEPIYSAVVSAAEYLFRVGMDSESYKDAVVSAIIGEAESICGVLSSRISR